MKMKTMAYDSKADAAYAEGFPDMVFRTVQINSDINVDLTASGRVAGIEILNAKSILSKALGTRLSSTEMDAIEYEIEEKAGIYLHVRRDQRQASLVLPDRILPA